MLGGQGADFLRGVAFWSIRCAGLLILRDRCITSYDLASTFRGRRSTVDRWTGKSQNASHESVSSALNFPFLKEVSQNSSFLMSCTSKNEEVSQNCFVSDVVKLKKMKTSHRIVPFWTFLCSNITEVSQNFFVFDLPDR